MDIIEILKAIVLGIVEGITEWLPISSTGHMILVDEVLKLNMSEKYIDMFLVVIQLGAILAVVVLFWKDIIPFEIKPKLTLKMDILNMWVKILVACVPAAIVGILWDDAINALFYNYVSVSIALVVFGILFIAIENRNRGRTPEITSIDGITYKTAILIGIFQLIAAVFPGTSRSGATILGGILIGMSRTVAAEFTFYLAIPVMAGASLLKLLKFGFSFSSLELMVLGTGTLVAFIVSFFVIKFLMSYIKKHDFKVFGWYRIVLGLIVVLFFLVKGS